MPTSTMRTAVLQATAIYIFSEILHHHTSSDIFNGILKNEGVQNFTAVINRTASLATLSASATPSHAVLRDSDITNQTWGAPSSHEGSRIFPQPSLDKSFYNWSLCRRVVLHMIMSSLQYYWFICLERLMPARPRRRAVEYEKAEVNDIREEEIVRKWILQGRVNRASLNWCNTSIKWILDLTVGRMIYHSIELAIETCLRFKIPKLSRRGVKTHLMWSFIGEVFSIAPLARLVALIAVPARSQLLFVAAADLVMSLFMVTLIRVLATWAVKTDFAQTALRNMTIEAEKEFWAGKSLSNPQARFDEL